MTDTAPLTLHRATVRPEWIDYNGHMNVAYYLLAFDQATDAVLDHLGAGKAYVEEENRSLFVVEAHLTYAREVTEGDALVFDTLVLGADAKRLQLFHTMRHETEGFLAATAEFMLLHVDLDSRRAAPFPDSVNGRVAELARRHTPLPRPPQAGRSIALPVRTAESGGRA